MSALVPTFRAMRAVAILVTSLGFAVLSCAAPGSTQQHSSACSASAVAFWNEFRTAVVENRLDVIQSKTKFPFYTRGSLDSDKRKALDAGEFKKQLPALLDADTGLSPDGQPLPMHTYIKNYERLRDSDCDSGHKKIRIANWVFDLTANGWNFSFAYTE